MPCAPLPVTRCPPGARPGPVLLPACALVVFLNHSPSLGLACSEPPLASHCHQVKDKRLSLVFKALHSLCLPTAPLSFFPIHPPSVSVLPAARSSPYRPHLCGPKSSHRLRPSSNAATTLSVKQSRTWHGSQCAPAQPHGVCALIAPSCLQPMGSGAHSGSSRAHRLSLSFPDSLPVWEVVSVTSAQSRLGWGRRRQLLPRCRGADGEWRSPTASSWPDHRDVR